MEFYWQLTYGDYKDLQSVKIPPASVETIKRRWSAGDVIHLSTGSIPANQVRSFEITDKQFNAVPLLEAASQAFNEPVVTDEGIGTRWVKKPVTQAKWDKYYSASPGYKYLDQMNNMVMVAFKVATHDVDVTKTPYCNESEVQQLTR